MVIKNLTDNQVEVRLMEIAGEHTEYSLFIMPYGFTEVEKVRVINADKYAGILDFGYTPVATPVKETKVVEEKKAQEEAPIIEEATIVEEPEDEGEEKSPEKFICDECGAEFASARGLASHKNKVHNK